VHPGHALLQRLDDNKDAGFTEPAEEEHDDGAAAEQRKRTEPGAPSTKIMKES